MSAAPAATLARLALLAAATAARGERSTSHAPRPPQHRPPCSSIGAVAGPRRSPSTSAARTAALAEQRTRRRPAARRRAPPSTEPRGAAESILGPTNDAIADLAVFGPMPAGVPTPPGSFVVRHPRASSVARMNDETSATRLRSSSSRASRSLERRPPSTSPWFADLGMDHLGSDSTAQNDYRHAAAGRFRCGGRRRVADRVRRRVPRCGRRHRAAELRGSDDGGRGGDLRRLVEGHSPVRPVATVTRGSLVGQACTRDLRSPPTCTYATDDAAGLLGQVAAGDAGRRARPSTPASPTRPPSCSDTDDLATGLTWTPSAATSAAASTRAPATCRSTASSDIVPLRPRRHPTPPRGTPARLRRADVGRRADEHRRPPAVRAG